MEGSWYDFTGRRAITDAEGRFRLEGLLPRIPYTVVAAEDSITDSRCRRAQCSTFCRSSGVAPYAAAKGVAT